MPRISNPVEAAHEVAVAAQQRRDAIKAEYDAALEEAAGRQLAHLQSRAAIYSAGAVIVRDDEVATLRRQLDVAMVAATQAEATYRRLYNLALVAS